MLVQTITQYLQIHKRLVVPQLGAFIVKEPGGSVVFSELFRRDDGVLRGLLQSGGMSELEAAGAIDRFVFEIRLAMQDSGKYCMENFGFFQPGPNQTLTFVCEPAAVHPEEPSVSEQQVQPHKTPGASADKPIGSSPVSVGSTLQPDPSLKGLHYGKPLKTTSAYTFAERRKRRKTDRFVMVAIIAAIIAVAAIAFGYVHEAREKQAAEQAIEQMEPTRVHPAEMPDAETPTQTPQE